MPAGGEPLLLGMLCRQRVGLQREDRGKFLLRGGIKPHLRLAIRWEGGYHHAMSSDVTNEQLGFVRQWAAQGVDLNGIQKRLASDCHVHLTFMEVRFLLLDHGIVIAQPQEQKASSQEKADETGEKSEHEDPVGEEEGASEAPSGQPVVTLDELQLPGALISGKVVFPSGIKGAWMIDQTGRFGWNDLSASPSPDELQAFQFELTQLLRRA